MVATSRRAWISTLTFSVLIIVLTCMSAGCGDDARSDPPLSKRIYIERFNEVQGATPAVFANVSNATRDPKAAKPQLAAFDGLIEDLQALDPPRAWKDEHAQMLEALRAMRASVDVLSRAPAGKVAIVQTQLRLYREAEASFAQAVEQINATR